jgi:hypothetical protein
VQALSSTPAAITDSMPNNDFMIEFLCYQSRLSGGFFVEGPDPEL